MTRSFKICVIAAGLILAANFIQLTDSAEQVAPARQTGLSTPEQRTSYALGLEFGPQIKQELAGVKLDPRAFALGILDVLSAQKPRLSEEERKALLDVLQKQMQAAAATRDAQTKVVSAKNREAAAAFLAANKKKPGVLALPSGLQYQVLKAGTGASPVATNMVKVHYHGTLIDGTVFDSSVQRNEPIEIPLNGVISGWTEAVTKMKVGGKWRLFIPPDQAYGDNPRPGGPIGPGMLLVFEVELLDIVK